MAKQKAAEYEHAADAYSTVNNLGTKQDYASQEKITKKTTTQRNQK